MAAPSNQRRRADISRGVAMTLSPHRTFPRRSGPLPLVFANVRDRCARRGRGAGVGFLRAPPPTPARRASVGSAPSNATPAPTMMVGAGPMRAPRRPPTSEPAPSAPPPSAFMGSCQNAEYTQRILYGSFQARGQNLLDLDGHAALLAASILLCGAVFCVLTDPRPHQASYQARKNSTSTGASASVLTSCRCPSNMRSCACGMAALNARAVSCMKG